MTQKRGLPLSRLLSTGMSMWTDPKHKPSLSLLPAWITKLCLSFHVKVLLISTSANKTGFTSKTKAERGLREWQDTWSEPAGWPCRSVPAEEVAQGVCPWWDRKQYSSSRESRRNSSYRLEAAYWWEHVQSEF
jgi:hypothetical protein